MADRRRLTRALYSTGELSERWGMSPTWVRERIHAQELRAEVWVNGRRRTFRVPADAADDFERRMRRQTERDDW